MFDAKKLLEALGAPAQPAAASPAAPAPAAAAPTPAAASFGAGTLLSDFIGYVARDNPPAPAPAAGDGQEGAPAEAPPAPKPPATPDLTDHLLGKAQEFLRSPQGNAAVNALVLGLAKKVATSDTTKKLALGAKSSGLALIGELTQKARRLQAGAAAPALAAPAAPAPSPADAAGDESGLLLLRTMIAAAAADGVLDEAERRRIGDAMRRAGMDAAAAQFLEAEFARPATVEALAADARTPELAARVYAAARLTIEPDRTEERVFLARLAGALSLDTATVAGIDAAAAGLAA